MAAPIPACKSIQTSCCTMRVYDTMKFRFVPTNGSLATFFTYYVFLHNTDGTNWVRVPQAAPCDIGGYGSEPFDAAGITPGSVVTYDLLTFKVYCDSTTWKLLVTATDGTGNSWTFNALPLSSAPSARLCPPNISLYFTGTVSVLDPLGSGPISIDFNAYAWNACVLPAGTFDGVRLGRRNGRDVLGVDLCPPTYIHRYTAGCWAWGDDADWGSKVLNFSPALKIRMPGFPFYSNCPPPYESQFYLWNADCTGDACCLVTLDGNTYASSPVGGGAQAGSFNPCNYGGGPQWNASTDFVVAKANVDEGGGDCQLHCYSGYPGFISMVLGCAAGGPQMGFAVGDGTHFLRGVAPYPPTWPNPGVEGQTAYATIYEKNPLLLVFDFPDLGRIGDVWGRITVTG